MSARTAMLRDLDHALAGGAVGAPARTLGRITDLFVAGASRYSEDQIDLFDDVMARLVTVIEVRARALLAVRLAPIPNAPAKVISLLAFDDAIEVAGPVLRQSERLDDTALVVNASCKTQQHLLAICQRKSLSESVTDVIIARGESGVLAAVARNAGARFSDQGIGILVKRAKNDDALAIQVGARPDLPRQHFLRLLDRASAVVRIRLAAQISSASSALDSVITEVAEDIRSETREGSRVYVDAHDEIDELVKGAGLTEADVHRFAHQRRFEQTAVALSKLCNVPLGLVEHALHDAATEILLILCKLGDFSLATTREVLLLQAADRGMSSQDLDTALASFARLSAATARHMLKFQTGRFNGRAKATAASKPAGNA